MSDLVGASCRSVSGRCVYGFYALDDNSGFCGIHGKSGYVPRIAARTAAVPTVVPLNPTTNSIVRSAEPYPRKIELTVLLFATIPQATYDLLSKVIVLLLISPMVVPLESWI